MNVKKRTADEISSNHFSFRQSKHQKQMAVMSTTLNQLRGLSFDEQSRSSGPTIEAPFTDDPAVCGIYLIDGLCCNFAKDSQTGSSFCSNHREPIWRRTVSVEHPPTMTVHVKMSACIRNRCHSKEAANKHLLDPPSPRRFVDLDVSLADTILAVKLKLQAKTGMPPAVQRYRYCARYVPEDTLLRDMGLQDIFPQVCMDLLQVETWPPPPGLSWYRS